MALDSTNLAIAELTLYIILLAPAGYVFWRHGKRGWLGWGYLIVLCALRIASAGLQINNHVQETKGKAPNTTGSVLNSVGVSPLLLSIAGVLHEASMYSNIANHKIDIMVQVLFHVGTVTGIAIAAVGGKNLASAKTDKDVSTDHGLQEGGSILLLLVILGLVVYCIMTLRRLKRSGESLTILRDAKLLTYAAAAAIVFAFVRVVYSVVYSFDHSPSLNPFTATFAVRFVLIFLVQLAAALVLVIGGLVTRNISFSGLTSASTSRANV